ncbi:MAG: hypothetical protein Q3982_03055 [Phoenicibacter congonensis]|uniref:Uncharacterized protein n=1 Tax=Phoenicibacter congonensis TaxID=1944646 RepID=A0AA43RLF2_9ACTN|nr:hypothetical protein [Phoenicibacter congonensis]
MKNAQRITIELNNGFKLVAEQNTDPNYRNEIFVGVLAPDGTWHQDLAIVRCAYLTKNGKMAWKDDEFDVLVYGDKDNEDFTDNFTVGLYREEGIVDSPDAANKRPISRVRHLNFSEVKALKIGDEVVIQYGESSFMSAKITRAMFWNSDADEPAWEIETDNGFIDAYSVYQEVL